MRTDVARMVFTDAPSPIAMAGHVAASDHPKDGAVAEIITDAQFAEFSRNWISAVLPYLVDGGLLGTFIDWRDLPMAHVSATALGLTPLDLVVWATASVGPGGLYPSQHRLLPLFKKAAGAHVSSIALGGRGRHRTRVDLFRRLAWIGHATGSRVPSAASSCSIPSLARDRP
jgi:hypothetical protein